MNENVTVREVMEREYVGVSESDSIVETTELLLREDAELAVVLRGSDPVGIVTERDILTLVVGGLDPETATVEDVMTETVPTVSPAQTLPEARDKMSSWSTSYLVVSTGGEPDGIVTEHDILATSMLSAESATTERETRQREVQEQMAAAASNTATTSESASNDAFDEQGICEMCGTLTRDLSSFNGQLLCADCRDI